VRPSRCVFVGWVGVVCAPRQARPRERWRCGAVFCVASSLPPPPPPCPMSTFPPPQALYVKKGTDSTSFLVHMTFPATGVGMLRRLQPPTPSSPPPTPAHARVSWTLPQPVSTRLLSLCMPTECVGVCSSAPLSPSPPPCVCCAELAGSPASAWSNITVPSSESCACAVLEPVCMSAAFEPVCMSAAFEPVCVSAAVERLLSPLLSCA
jgi:hypothetical protein